MKSVVIIIFKLAMDFGSLIAAILLNTQSFYSFRLRGAGCVSFDLFISARWVY